MTFPKPADGLDGVSVVNVEIDKNNHLICTLSDSSTVDAGEIKGIGGGLVQEKKNKFPTTGRTDTLYLDKDKDELYSWDGSRYKPVAGTGGNVLAELKVASITFDGVADTFDLPVDDVKVNVYINGMYMTEDVDYTIDRTIQPNKITLDTVYEPDEICTVTYLLPVSGGGGTVTPNPGPGPNPTPPADCDCPEIKYVDKKDIDKLFENEPPVIPDGTDLTFATKEDINAMFKDEPPYIPSDVPLATKQDIDNMFKGDEG